MRQPRGQFAKIADTITGTMRRRQRDREPRVLLYDANGVSRRLPPADDAHAGIVELAGKLVALANANGQSQDGER